MLQAISCNVLLTVLGLSGLPSGWENNTQPLTSRKNVQILITGAPNSSATERFNYLYSDEELKEWIPRVKELASKTRQLHVLFNNCYADKAVVNAGQTKLMLD